MITYLYHKKHAKTGLNYFGKTIKNPYKYHGSGVYWKRHLKQHGKEIITIQVWEFTDLNECQTFALDFSIKNNIVNSTEWANCVLENGVDGQSPGFKNAKLAEYNRIHSGVNHISKKPGFIPNRLGKKDSIETIEKKRMAHLGKSHAPLSEETKQKISAALSRPRPEKAGKNNSMYGYKWSKEQLKQKSDRLKGTHWWNNSIQECMARGSPGITWVRGRLK